MADFEISAQRLTANIIYFGPDASGKTTNLRILQERFHGRTAGEYALLDLAGGRGGGVGVLPFDCAFEGPLYVTLKVWGVPTGCLDELIRTVVLNRADGLVFVADSLLSRADENSRSFRQLAESLRRAGRPLDAIPLVIQYNKRDLDETLREESVLRHWEGSGIPVVFAAATEGIGVCETMEALLVRLHVSLEEQVGIESQRGIHRDLFLAGIMANGMR